MRKWEWQDDLRSDGSCFSSSASPLSPMECIASASRSAASDGEKRRDGRCLSPPASLCEACDALGRRAESCAAKLDWTISRARLDREKKKGKEKKVLARVHARRVNSSLLVCSLSSHRNSYIGFVFSSHFNNSK